MRIFVDTSAFYALADIRDQHHEKAKAYYLNNYRRGRFWTSEYVFVETWSLIHHKLGKAAVRKYWETMRGNVVSLELVADADVERAWEIFTIYEDQDFSLVDCTSFAMLERLGINDVFAFDIHFNVFRSNTGGAFQVYPTILGKA